MLFLFFKPHWLKIHVLERVKIIESLGEHSDSIMNQSIGRVQVVLLPIASIGELLKILHHDWLVNWNTEL